MAIKPTSPKTQVKGQAYEVFNSLRDGLGTHFQSIVPSATADFGNVRDIGTILQANPELQNAFLSALVNRIGRVILTGKMYTNPWAMFKKGLLEYGETVEEIFVDLAKVENFDPSDSENTLFKRSIPDVRSAFHTMNFQKVYETTVSDDQLRQAFLSSQGISDLIAKIIDAIYKTANFDELVSMKYLLGRQALRGAIKTIAIPTVNKTNASDIVTVIKATSNKLEYLTTQYNRAKVHNQTVKDDQFIIMNADFEATLDVNVLASAFNMDYVKFMGHRVPIDSFGFNPDELKRLDELFSADVNYQPITTTENAVLQGIPSMLLDRDFFMVFDNFETMNEQYNGKGLYWNYFYHTWKTFSVSPFANGILFSDVASTITGVTVTPNVASVTKGQKLQFTTSVQGTGFINQEVTFELDGAETDSTITPSGFLSVGANETVSTITVTVKSVADDTKSTTATITII